jgi:hypothetical protein
VNFSGSESCIGDRRTHRYAEESSLGFVTQSEHREQSVRVSLEGLARQEERVHEKGRIRRYRYVRSGIITV